MKILITGCNGQLGTELQKQLRQEKSELGPVPERLRNATVIAVDVDQLDITDRQATVDFVRRQHPDTIINCAAFTNVDGCETNRDAAFKVNAIGPRNLAMAAEKIGARLIHVSTDYVFPGTENGGIPLDEATLPGPISAYGSTKRLGEQYVQKLCRRQFIVGTAWCSSHGRARGPPRPPRTRLRISRQAWRDFACEIIRLSGVQAQVTPCTSAQYKQMNPASTNRPAWSALDNRMLRCTAGDPVRPWQQALECFFAHWDGENGMK